RRAVFVLVQRASVGDTRAIIANRWVYAVMKDENGIIKRFKARLVLQADIYGINYFKTYAPVIRFETQRFSEDDQFSIKCLLGVKIVVDRQNRAVFLSQENYINEILRFGMIELHWSDNTGKLIDDNRDEENHRDIKYREIIGALQYLVSGSRPNLAHAVRCLGQHMSNYDATHYARSKRTKRLNQLNWLFTQMHYANDAEDCRSISGYASTLNGINSLSTMEVQYVDGLRDSFGCGIYVMNCKFQTPRLMSDNQAAIVLTTKPGKHHKSKHIDNKFHFVRHLAVQEELEVQHVGTNEQRD
ncbi:TPA: LOW QUALITY PROTEIN: hypothetical protein N0F65_004136, partial [Lagenidium giganteum]